MFFTLLSHLQLADSTFCLLQNPGTLLKSFGPSRKSSFSYFSKNTYVTDLTHSVFVVSLVCTFHTEQRSLYLSTDTVSHLKLLYKSNYLRIMNPNKTCNIKLVHLLSVTQRPPSCQLSFQRRFSQTIYTGSEMKKSSSQEQKIASDDDPLSPWRAAKPRKPLRDLADAQDSPKGRRQEQENESPPNSSHKESTRLESGLRGVGGMDLSQVVGHYHSFQA